MCFDHLADVHSRVAADWLRGCESVWPDDGCYHSFVINLTNRWSINKVNEPVLVHCDTCRATRHTHSHFSPSISVLMCFIGATNNVTFALVMQSQLNGAMKKDEFHRLKPVYSSVCNHSVHINLNICKLSYICRFMRSDIRYAKESCISFHCSSNFSLSFVLFYSNACKSPWAVQGNSVLHLNRAMRKHTLLQFN